ncbi:substrate-binding domain-containing protein [Mucilaginibacter sp. UR6-1]|uniref:PstS family phosphate ABC transporter substrate-binding protein n=1 Tax=Mucilaginibacter sp. UR6-1 TaxID=1435643 RepID=UPI001E592F3D|nr:substrate-binding domain-containing protein [Mucilaginibacter sp. UR6-1]MCC8409412.1 substrate-binding domain-containing protein [Mucilaginibacter sp. UR6-1]
MKKNNLKLLLAVTAGVLLSACGSSQKDNKAPSDSFAEGKIKILADESFEPIVAEEQVVFESLFSKAKLDIQYLSENELLNLYLNDSVRVAIMSRELTPAEKKIFDERRLAPVVDKFAVDAVALIVNKGSADTLITVSEIKKMLNGQTKTDQNIVFDNPNSSVVRYLKAFSGNKELKQKNIYALKSNKEVVKYVSEHEGAIGIVGFSWLNDPDEDYAPYVQKVQIMGVRDEGSKEYPNEYFKPSQTSLVLKQYPLSRELYILNSTGRVGLGTGFASFLASERGQRIILKSGLLPDSIPRREINIKKE